MNKNHKDYYFSQNWNVVLVMGMDGNNRQITTIAFTLVHIYSSYSVLLNDIVLLKNLQIQVITEYHYHSMQTLLLFSISLNHPFFTLYLISFTANLQTCNLHNYWLQIPFHNKELWHFLSIWSYFVYIILFTHYIG